MGDGGVLAALQRLPHLEALELEPASAGLWALYDNAGQRDFAANPFKPAGTEGTLLLPPHVPRPVPEEWASIWSAPTLQHPSRP